MESYNKNAFKENGLDYDFVQDNESFSKEKGVLRGLHFQRPPYTQAKLVRCTKGKVYDVVVDIRKESSTYGKWIGVELSPENNRQLLVPRGFLHGFQTLTDDVIFSYKFFSYRYVIFNNSIHRSNCRRNTLYSSLKTAKNQA